MSPNEFAFLALGLLLGAAVGASLVIIIRSRPVMREVRLTVEHAAVPRRSTTLSNDAFQGAAGEVARGGPADRRAVDRDYPATSDGPVIDVATGAPTWPPGPVAPPPWTRTTVRYAGSPGAGHGAPTSAVAAPIGIPILGEPDPDLARLRAQVAVAAERASRSGHLTATALLERRAAVLGMRPEPEGRPEEVTLPAGLSPIGALLRGHHPTLVLLTRAIAGDDVVERRRWGALLVILADGLRDAAIRAGVLSFPADEPFWATFTIDEARRVAAALASTGHRFDGRGGWADDRVPLHRDLTIAVADAGLEPGRIRHWPDADATRTLYRGTRVAAEEFVAERAPTLDLEAVRSLLGSRAVSLGPLWADWDRARPILLGLSPDVSPAGGVASAG